MTASLRVTAAVAFLPPIFLTSRVPQAERRPPGDAVPGCLEQVGAALELLIDRDRGTPRGATPPTPPGIRVTYPAVRLG
jgi:hypothetical protein